MERKDKCRNPGTVHREKPDNTVKCESHIDVKVKVVKVDENKQLRTEIQKKKTSEE